VAKSPVPALSASQFGHDHRLVTVAIVSSGVFMRGTVPRSWRLGLAITLATAALAASAVPAEAVGAFHAAVRVSTNCYGVHLAQTTSSTQRGFAMCGTGNYQIAYVEGTGTKTWRSVPTKLTGYVVAVADDGSTTYLLYTPNDKTLSLATRTHGGTLHHSVIHRSAAHNSFRGGIVAKSGKWWADWVDYNGGTTEVWQAHTYKSVQHATKTKLIAGGIQLALNGSTVVMAWSQPDLVGIQVGSPSGATTWTHSTAAKKFLAGMQLVIDSGHVGVAYVAGDSHYLNQVYWTRRGSSGKWSTKQLSTAEVSNAPYLAAADVRGTLVVSWLTSHSTAMVEVRRNGAWSHRAFGSSSGPNISVAATGVSGGRALVVYGNYGTKRSESRLES
jgi:hypothetical protein